MNELIRIDEFGKTTARELYEFLQLDPTHYTRWTKQNIEDNQFAEDSRDYEVLAIKGENPQGGRPTKDYKLSIDFAKKLCMVSKSERGEQARNYFIEVEKRFKQNQVNLPQMTQTQLIAAIANSQVDQEKQLKQIAAAQSKQATELQNIRDTVTLSPNSWRKDSSALINKIAVSMGGYEHVKPLRAESYKLLDERMGVDLQCRLTNKRRRMADEGICKSKRDKLNQLDVIADDKKLIEGYIAIIKEMAIKYGV